MGTKVCRYNWHNASTMGWPFPMLKYKYIFSNKIYGSNFIKHHSETVMVWNYQTADCSFKDKYIVSIIIILGTLTFPVGLSLKLGNGMECELTIGLGENGNVKIHCRSSL